MRVNGMLKGGSESYNYMLLSVILSNGCFRPCNGSVIVCNGWADGFILANRQRITMSRTAMMGRGVVLRGGFSLYLSIDEGWREAAGIDVDDTCRLEIEEVGDSSLTVVLFVDEDYSEVEDPPEKFDIEPVDIKTDIQWCLPADIRREFGITADFSYNAEFIGDGQIRYEIVSPTAQDERLLT